MRRFIALEAEPQDEQPVDDTIEDTTAPKEGAADTTESGDGSDTTTETQDGDDAFGSTGDDASGDGTGEETPSDEDTEEAELEEKKNAVIELADPDDLAVNELAGLQAKQDKKDAKAEYEKDSEAADNLSGELTVLSQAMESYRLTLLGMKPSTGHEISLLKQIQFRHGLGNKVAALESYDRIPGKIGMESFKETFKHILEKILAAIARIYEYIKRFLRDYFHENRDLKNKLKRMHDEYATFRESKGKDLDAFLSEKGMKFESYITDRLGVRNALTIRGDFITEAKFVLFTNDGRERERKQMSVEDAITRSLDVLKLHESFVNDDSKKFCDFCDATLTQLEPASNGELGLSNYPVTSTLLDGVHLVDSVAGFTRTGDDLMYVSDSYLGDICVVTEVPRNKTSSRLKDELAFIGQWKVHVGFYTKEFATGTLPRLDERQIKEIYEGMLHINEEMEKMRSSVEKYEVLVARFKSHMDKAKDTIRFISDDLSTSEILQRETCIALIRAVKAWLDNSTTVFDKTASYGKLLQLGWIKYMALLTLEDAQNTKDMNARRV